MTVSPRPVVTRLKGPAMLDFFANWSPDAIMGLVAIVGGLLTIVGCVGLMSWCLVRRAQIAADLKRDLVQRGLSVEQIERLIDGPREDEKPYYEKQLEGSLASLLAQSEVPGPLMTEVLRIYQATDGGTKKAVYDAIEEIIGSEPTEDQLLAAVRTLCPPKAGTVMSPQYDSARVGV
jgi:hypothetical protein